MRARDNPLTVQRLQGLRYRALRAPGGAVPWAELERRFEELGYRAAIVGPQGHGKTTLIAELAERWRAAGWEVRMIRLQLGTRRLPDAEARRLFTGLDEGTRLVIDGADVLAPLARRWLHWRARRAGGLLVTAHAADLLPTLWTCETSPGLLRALLFELGIDDERRPGPRAEELLATHGGNVRDALAALYDLYAALPDAGP